MLPEKHEKDQQTLFRERVLHADHRAKIEATQFQSEKEKRWRRLFGAQEELRESQKLGWWFFFVIVFLFALAYYTATGGSHGGSVRVQ